MKINEFREKCEKHLREFQMFSPEALELLTMLAAHESSGCVHWRQIGGGPARGPFGLEIPTHDEIWKHSDTIKARAQRLGIREEKALLETDLRYNIFVARHYLAMDKNPLPKGFINMANYAKTYWNTHGKATPEKYLNDLIMWERGVIG